MYRKLIITTIILLTGLMAYGQTVTTDASTSKLTIAGTSTLHDWTMEATNMSGSAEVVSTEGNLTVKSLTFTVPVRGLESGKSAMDKNAFEALKQKKHPAITYQMVKINAIQEVKGGYLLKTTGKLTIAGKTCTINMDVKASIKDGYVFSGKIPLKMTDYGVDPPKALMGTVKTGNEIDIIFNIRYL